MKVSKSGGRLLWVDTLKIFSIYLVILIHSTDPSLYVYLGELGSLVFQNILRACVPLFVMLSGALLLNKQEDSVLFFSKRAFKILIPWTTWTIIYVFWAYFFQGAKIDSLNSLVKIFYVTSFSKFWFMPMIFGLYLIVPILRMINLKNRSYILGILLGWFLFVSFLPILGRIVGFNFPEGTLSSVQFFGYFILGYLLLRVSLNKKIVYYSIFTLLLSFAFAYFGNNLSSVDLVGGLNSYPYNFISPITVMTSGALFVLWRGLFEWREGEVGESVRGKIVMVSGLILSVYLSHQVIVEVVDRLIPVLRFYIYSLNPLLSTLLWSVVVFVLSVLLIFLLKKLPGLKVLFG